MNENLKILFVEDIEEDIQRVEEELNRAGFNTQIVPVTTREEYLLKLGTPGLNLIISDYFLQQFSGIEALNILNRSGLDLPFFLLSGTFSEDLAVESMRAGAKDYFLKNNLSRLVPAVKRELLEYQIRRKRREAEKKEQAVQLHYQQSQKLESLGTLAGGIAHEFNNLLTSVMGNLELAQTSLPSDHTVQDYLEEALFASTRAKELVQQILAFGRKQGTERHSLEIGPVIHQALKLVRSSLPSTVEMIRDISDTCPLIRANATQLNQVVMNLCTNAAHALGDRPGRIEIRCHEVVLSEEAALIHPALTAGRYVQVTVSDNGHGMSAETQSRVFEPFFTTKPQGEGTGLGLTMVHSIMEVHEGAISLESKEGIGTSVHLYFPALTEREKPATRSLADLCRGEGEHILFVDDDKGIIHLARAMLKHIGYRVTAFNDPTQAYEAFASEPERYNLVISDLTMPSMTGLDLAEKIRSHAKPIPFLLITGYAGALETTALADHGIHGVIYKPFNQIALARAIYNLLKRVQPYTTGSTSNAG